MSKATKAVTSLADSIKAMQPEQRIAAAVKMYKGEQAKQDKARASLDASQVSAWSSAVLFAHNGVSFDAIEAADVDIKKLGAYRSAKSGITAAREAGVPIVTADDVPVGKTELALLVKGKALDLDLSGKTQQEMKAAIKAAGDDEEDTEAETREASPEEICRSAFLHMKAEPEKYARAHLQAMKQLVALLVQADEDKAKGKGKGVKVDTGAGLGAALAAANAGKVNQGAGVPA